jgi:hypothetical protein
LRKALEAELLSNGEQLVGPQQAQAEVRVTLAENLMSYLLVAEIVRREAREVAVVAFPRSSVAAALQPSERLRLEAKLVWEQEGAFVDFAVGALPGRAGPYLFVLDPGKLSLYTSGAAHWQLEQSHAIVPRGLWPRDLRGHLELEEGLFTVFLPGLECGGMVAPAWSMDCQESGKEGGAWALHSGKEEIIQARFVAGRNFFAGLFPPGFEPAGDVPPFYSAATVHEQGRKLWVFAGTDGLTRLYAGGREPETIFSGWGSEVAGIESDCGAGWHVLATRPGDWTESEAVRAYQITDAGPVAASEALQLPGPVTALWTAADGRTANAVVRSLSTGHYEAYTLAIACGR